MLFLKTIIDKLQCSTAFMLFYDAKIWLGLVVSLSKQSGNYFVNGQTMHSKYQYITYMKLVALRKVCDWS